MAQLVKYLPASIGVTKDTGLTSGSAIFPGVGNGNPLQNSCLENFMDSGAWQTTIHGVAKSQTQLSIYIIPGTQYVLKHFDECTRR